MENERIILRTRNKGNISMLIDKMVNEEVVNILGVNYKVVSARVGAAINTKTEKSDIRIFELEGVIK